MGTRGIPARYGGFETFAEQLGVRLAARGWDVSVYGRRGFFQCVPGAEYHGVKLRFAPTIFHKYLETPLHALFSFIDLLRHRVDLVLLCNAANSPFAFIPRLLGIPLAINVDGIERNRSKWSSIGKLWYLIGERCSTWFASRIIADAEVIADYYRERFGADPAVIAYGAEPLLVPPGEILNRFGLTPGRYLLYVSRFEPENNALGVVEAYRGVHTDLPLVMVGDAPYAREYIARVKGAADSRVIFTGFQFGAAYHELRSHCYAYIQATEVGGTHPALVEAMAWGNCIIANRVPEHEEVLADAGEYYQKNNFDECRRVLQSLLDNPRRAEELRAAAKLRAQERYSWNAVVDQYESLCEALLSEGEGGRPCSL